MKKLLVLIFISLMLFASCSSGGKNPGDSTQVSGIPATSQPDDGSSGVTSGTQTDIPDTSALKKVGDSLWEIPLPDYLSSNGHAYSASGMYTRGDYLLVVYCDTPNTAEPSDDAILLLFDIRTGKMLAETRHDRMARFSLLDDGYVSVIDDSTLKTTILDPSFKAVAEYPALGNDIMTSLAFVSCDRKYFVWYSDASVVTMKNLETGAVTEIGAVVSDPAYCAEYNGTAYLLSYDDNGEVNYALDMNAGRLTRLDEYNGTAPVGLSLPAFVHSEVSSIVMLPEERGRLYMFDDLNTIQTYLFDYRDGYFVSQTPDDGDETGVNLYSVLNSRRLSVNVPTAAKSSYIGFMRLAGYGEVFIDVTVGYEYPRLFMWLPGEPSEGDSIGITVTDRAGLLSRTDDMKNHIETKYGIKVFYGEEGSRFNAYDYAGAVVTDEIRIYNAMSILFSTLSKYPSEIFPEMLDNQLSGFNFYLCGKLTGTADTSINSALAITFTDYESGTKRIACDVGGYYMLDQTIAHELMHVMDDAIWNAENETGIPYYSLWLGLLPEGMNYYYYYVDANGNEPNDTSYTVMGEENADRIYFIDPYSKTYPTEDRARIMEYLFKTEDGVLSSSIRGDHLIEKCRALCLILRKVFPSIAQSDERFWESGLGPIDENEMYIFIEKYNKYLETHQAAG